MKSESYSFMLLMLIIAKPYVSSQARLLCGVAYYYLRNQKKSLQSRMLQVVSGSAIGTVGFRSCNKQLQESHEINVDVLLIVTADYVSLYTCLE